MNLLEDLKMSLLKFNFVIICIIYKRYKNAFFFLSQAPTHHSFTFNFQFLELKLKACLCRILYFLFCFVFIKVYVFFNKTHGLFDFKTS